MSRNAELNINPVLIQWAIHRADLDISMLKNKFPKIEDWCSGISKPTLRQLEMFSKAAYVPTGYLFLPNPPEESIPIPDFRTIKDQHIQSISPNLLDTIYLCQQRQDWYRDYARANSYNPIYLIGKISIHDEPVLTAEAVRKKFQISIEERKKLSNWADALRLLVSCAEKAGVLVMSSSIVGSNTHRKLSLKEFRGFALADEYAPLVFINSADSKAAQMFTLAHEIAHLCLGESGISNFDLSSSAKSEIENWCNAVAAELLMPLSETKELFIQNASIELEIQRLAKLYKVSSLVVIRRLFDAGCISEKQLWKYYNDEVEIIKTKENGSSGGGDFYRTLSVRTGRLFAQAVLSSTLEGYTLFQDAFRMLGIKKTETFYEAARELGVMT